MPKKIVKKEGLSGRKLALTILIGVFIAIMVVTLFNLLVSYVYEPPAYEKYCNYSQFGPYPIKAAACPNNVNCTFSQALQEQQDGCYSSGGQPVFNYDVNGCTTSLKECNMCQKTYDSAMKAYNRSTFFIFAVIGFILIVAGLFIGSLLIQIIALPAGAFLVIEAAVKNFDDKLYVIITFALLIVAATYLALKKLR